MIAVIFEVEPAEGQSVKDGNYVKGQGRNFLRDIKTPFTRTSGGRQVAVPVFERIRDHLKRRTRRSGENGR